MKNISVWFLFHNLEWQRVDYAPEFKSIKSAKEWINERDRKTEGKWEKVEFIDSYGLPVARYFDQGPGCWYIQVNQY